MGLCAPAAAGLQRVGVELHALLEQVREVLRAQACAVVRHRDDSVRLAVVLLHLQRDGDRTLQVGGWVGRCMGVSRVLGRPVQAGHKRGTLANLTALEKRLRSTEFIFTVSREATAMGGLRCLDMGRRRAGGSISRRAKGAPASVTAATSSPPLGDGPWVLSQKVNVTWRASAGTCAGGIYICI